LEQKPGRAVPVFDSIGMDDRSLASTEGNHHKCRFRGVLNRHRGTVGLVSLDHNIGRLERSLGHPV